MKVMKFVSNFDYILFIVIILLTVIGILFIYSANYNKFQDQSFPNYLKQIVFLFIGLCILTVFLFIPTKLFIKYALPFYIICLAFLILTIFFSNVVKGQKRFILQVSEFAKIATILLLSNFYYNRTYEQIKKLSTYLIGVLITLVPSLLILLQPDLGTVLVFIPILLGISFFAGIKKRYLLYSILYLGTVAFIPTITAINNMFFHNESIIINIINNLKYFLIVNFSFFIILILSLLINFNIIKNINEKFKKIFYWIMFFSSILLIGYICSFVFNNLILKDYQKDRLMIFLNPEFDPQDKGYHIINSKTTIGNGGLFGRGWCKGELTQEKYLPEHDTDFIFPVIAEEFGFFFGSMLVIFLYSLLFYRLLSILLNTKQIWESYILIGIISMLLFHILQNIGMSVGIMPITGIPLPFLSYGGSFLLTCFIEIAIVLNIYLNRYQF